MIKAWCSGSRSDNLKLDCRHPSDASCECKTPIDVWWELLTKPRAKLASVDGLSSEEECDEEEEDDFEEDPRGHSRQKGKVVRRVASARRVPRSAKGRLFSQSVIVRIFL